MFTETKFRPTGRNLLPPRKKIMSTKKKKKSTKEYRVSGRTI